MPADSTKKTYPAWALDAAMRHVAIRPKVESVEEAAAAVAELLVKAERDGRNRGLRLAADECLGYIARRQADAERYAKGDLGMAFTARDAGRGAKACLNWIEKHLDVLVAERPADERPAPSKPQNPIDALLKEVEALDAATVDTEFARYGLISETAESPGDDNGMDAAAASVSHSAALARLRARASMLFGADGFSVEDGYDWLPRWAGGKPRGLENQPPKVYRRQVFAAPVVSVARPAAPRLADIVRVLYAALDDARSYLMGRANREADYDGDMDAHDRAEQELKRAEKLAEGGS